MYHFGRLEKTLLAVCFFCFLSQELFGQNGQGTGQVVIISTSDLHGYVRSYDYYRDQSVEDYGFSKASSLIRKLKTDYPDAFLVDTGDTIQGNPMSDVHYKSFSNGRKEPIPMIKAMNLLKYDVAVPGNHDFNFGLSYLKKSIKEAEYPYICGNIFTTDKKGNQNLKSPFLSEYKIIKKKIGQNTVNVGFIGFSPPDIEKWDRRHVKDKLVVKDILETAKVLVPKIKKKGADIVIVLLHGGIATGDYKAKMNDPGYHLALLDGVDAVATGHAHQLFPDQKFFQKGKPDKEFDQKQGTLHGKPAVMPNYWGSHVGLIKLNLKREKNTWKVLSGTGEALPVKSYPEDPAIVAATLAEHQATLDYVRTPIATLKTPITSFFSRLADTAIIHLINKAQSTYVKKRIAAEEGSPYAALPILSSAAPFRNGFAGKDDYTLIKAGPIAIKDIANIYVFPNTIAAVKVNGAGLKGWLEHAAKNFASIDFSKEGAVNIINPQFQGYNFDVIDGVTYKIDISKPIGERIINLSWQGKPVSPSMEFIVVTNNYRAFGGGSFPGLDGSTVVFEDLVENRDVILEYVKAEKVLDITADDHWSLEKISPNKVRLFYETSPDAVEFSPPWIKKPTKSEKDETLLKFFIDL